MSEILLKENITKELIDQKTDKFIRENAIAEETINNLFRKANNYEFDDVFCRVACIDLIYSTQIQRFNKGGIVLVSKHIQQLAPEIDKVVKMKEIDYDFFSKLVDIKYDDIKDTKGKENKIYSFASKFMSFTMPEVYPIMDSNVKKALYGSDNSVSYKDFYNKIIEYKNWCFDELKVNLSLKELDMFLWQWQKDKRNSSE